MQEIEDLMRQQFQDAEQTPPPDTWEKIRQRMAAGESAGAAGSRQPAVNGKGPRRLWPAVVAIAGIALVTGAILMTGRNGSQETQQPTDNGAQLVASNNLAAADIDRHPVADIDRQPAAKDEPQPVVTGDQKPVAYNEPAPAANSEAQPAADNDYHPTTYSEPQPTAAPSQRLTASNSQQPVAKDEPQPPAANDRQPAGDTHQPAPDSQTATDNGNQKSATNRLDLTIPNFITPNNDGINDCWVIDGIEKYGKAELQIFTAQSKRVFSSSDYHGEFCGENLPAGNYFYVLVIRKQNYSRRGVLVIVR